MLARYPRRFLLVSETRPAAVIVLAAGEGKRMKSRTPKVLHSLCGRSMLGHALAAAQDLDPERLVVVTGHGRDQVIPEVARLAPDAAVVVQEQQLGTGHAVRMVTEAIGDVHGMVVVTYGDMPLLRGQTLRELVAGAPGRRQRGDRADRDGPPTLPGTGGSSGTPTARSPRIVEDARRHRRASGPSTRSTPAATPSTARCSPTRSSGSPPTTRRARSTSPTWWRSCAATATRSGPCSRPTPGRSRALTTGSSWRRCGGC